jgi:carbamoyltransferase
MWILGLSGGPDPIYPSADLKKDPRFVRRLGFRHDSAAVLLKDGVVISAVEEERLNRIKHTSKFPARAIQSCLQAGNISLTSVDRIAYSTSEKGVNELVSRYVSKNAGLNGPATGRAFVAGLFRRDFGTAIGATRIDFVEHHLAHAASTFHMSSLREALVVTLDGEGDGIAGTISIGSGQELTRIAEIPMQNSLGLFYLEFTQLLGYKFGDEYEVMGLASYGDPSRYQSALDGICVLLPDGIVEIDRRRIKAFEAVFERRQNDEPLTQAHMDLAAAVQEALERAVFHILSHYRAQTGQRDLCLAGGVALNSTMTGR